MRCGSHHKAATLSYAGEDRKSLPRVCSAAALHPWTAQPSLLTWLPGSFSTECLKILPEFSAGK